ncbi:MAG: hypothetical protein Q4F41_04470 [Eubacteriales bacterium]|nr:hypothetical protein [Eubacteriales bacterium]
MDSMFIMVDLIITGFGVYLLYAWFLMAQKGEVKENLVLPKNMTMKRCKDKDGFVNFMKPKMLGFGIVMLICGLFGLLNDFTGVLGNFSLLITVIFLVAAIWYGVGTKNAIKNYF